MSKAKVISELPNPEIITQPQENPQPIQPEPQPANVENVEVKPIKEDIINNEQFKIIQGYIEKQEAEKKERELAAYRETVEFALEDIIVKAKLDPDNADITKTEVAYYRENNPDATKDEIVRFTKFVTNRIVENEKAISKARQDEDFYKIGAITSKYGQKGRDLERSFRDSMKVNFGYTESMIDKFLKNMTPQEYVEAVSNFSEQKYFSGKNKDSYEMEYSSGGVDIVDNLAKLLGAKDISK